MCFQLVIYGKSVTLGDPYLYQSNLIIKSRQVIGFAYFSHSYILKILLSVSPYFSLPTQSCASNSVLSTVCHLGVQYVDIVFG